MMLWLLIASFFGLLFLITFIDAKINGGFKIETLNRPGNSGGCLV